MQWLQIEIKKDYTKGRTGNQGRNVMAHCAMKEERTTIEVTNSKHVDIECPRCKAVKRVPLTNFPRNKESHKVKCCGKIFEISLDYPNWMKGAVERPREIHIAGRCTNTSEGNAQTNIVVQSMTKNIVSFTASGCHRLRKGNRINLELYPGFSKRLRIYKKALVRLVKGNSVQCAFLRSRGHDALFDQLV